ncbi:MAG TPA: hypothetical protein VM617_06995 [Thermoanaerobaculia bacterium]|nr:hypothetical protein [Thermoanaerobaculia bacterium]
MSSRPWPSLSPVVPAVVVLVAAMAGLAALGDPADRLPAALGLLALAAAAWAIACRRLEAVAPTLGRRHLLLAILAVGLVVRLPLLALPPTLSDDLLRYLWDGRVLAAGADPWSLAPEAAELSFLRDDLWQRLPHRQVPTVYPPLALVGFSLAAALPAPILAWKGLLTLADLAACAALVALARRRGLPAARAAWYAWSPLVALEIAGLGHVDGLGVAAAVVAVLALSPPAVDGSGSAGRRGAVLAALAAAAGILLKLAPAAALGLWARTARRPLLFVTLALALAAAGLVPVVLAVGGVPAGLATYGIAWEFAGPVYEPLWRLVERSSLDHAAVALLDLAERSSGWRLSLDALYPFAYPQLLAKLLLAVGALAVVLRSFTDRDPIAGGRRLFGGLLICSATVYPWYLLWVMPWAALSRHTPWLLAAALAPLLYLPRLPGVELFPGVWAAVWGPPLLLVLLAGRRNVAAAEGTGGGDGR